MERGNTVGKQWPPNPLTAQYTLPGVINYLTLEFTNLERFKIMTNMEKLEMKYRIIQLQGELNSLKFVNNKQATRIFQLEQENARLRERLQGVDPLAVPPKWEEFVDLLIPGELPEVDLAVLKQTRSQLTKLMKEIVHLLKTPSVKVNKMDLPRPEDPHSLEFDVLMQKLGEFEFDDDKEPTHLKYFEESDITPHEGTQALEALVEPIYITPQTQVKEGYESDDLDTVVDHPGPAKRKQFSHHHEVTIIEDDSTIIDIDGKFVKTVNLNQIKFDNILDVFVVLLEDDGAALVFIDEDVGVVLLLIGDGGTLETVLHSIRGVNQADITKFADGQFGLVVSGIHGTAPTGFFSRVFNVVNANGGIHSEQIGHFVGDFFGDGQSIEFQLWVEVPGADNKEVKVPVEGALTTCTDVALAPHQLVYAVDGKPYRLNLVTQTLVLLKDEQPE